MIFNTRSIRSRLNEEEWEYYGATYYRYRQVYLGRSSDLLPSGKICIDDDLAPQKDLDWYAQVDRELNSIGCILYYREDNYYVIDKKFIVYDNVKLYAKEVQFHFEDDWKSLFNNEFEDVK